MEPDPESVSDVEQRSPFSLVLFYQIVIRPLMIVFVIVGCLYFLTGYWGVGCWLAAMLVVLAMLWRWLKDMMVNEAYVGLAVPADDTDEKGIPEGVGVISTEEAEIISIAITVIGWVIGLTTAVVLGSYGAKLYVAAPIGIAVVFLGEKLSATCLWRVRFCLKGKWLNSKKRIQNPEDLFLRDFDGQLQLLGFRRPQV